MNNNEVLTIINHEIKFHEFNNEELNLKYLDIPGCEDCEGLVQIAGNSMAPAYPPGCWIALKRQNYDTNNPNEIPYGNDFVVFVEDMITGLHHGYLRVLRRHKDPQRAKKYWVARSININDFDDFEIDISTVRDLWIVKQLIIRF